MNEMTVSGLFRYLIKGCAGEPMQEVRLDKYGIVGDRRGMIVDREGKFLSQRTHPRMALIKPTLCESGVELEIPGLRSRCYNPFSFPGERQRVQVTVWKDEVEALDQGDPIAALLTEFLETECRLVWMPQDFRRNVDPRFARRGEQAAFTDAFPILLIGEESLEELNTNLDAPVPMNRFRPSITVAGSWPYAEDDWAYIRIGGIKMHVAKYCARCEVTTIDQETGERTGNEPLKTLASYRTMAEPTTGSRGAMFGQNVIHLGEGVLRVGDKIEVDEFRA